MRSGDGGRVESNGRGFLAKESFVTVVLRNLGDKIVHPNQKAISLHTFSSRSGPVRGARRKELWWPGEWECLTWYKLPLAISMTVHLNQYIIKPQGTCRR